jgi:hypothetical protein
MKSSAHRRNLAYLLAAGGVFVCTLQAMYWPVLNKPGTPLAWWQVSWMAEVGHVVGEPVLALSLVAAFVVRGAYFEFLSWLLAIAWSLGLYWSLRRLQVGNRGARTSGERVAHAYLCVFLGTITPSVIGAASAVVPGLAYIALPGSWFGWLFARDEVGVYSMVAGYVAAVFVDTAVFAGLWYVAIKRLRLGVTVRPGASTDYRQEEHGNH